MLKSISAIVLGSALLLAPALAQADQSTEPASPYTVKTPGNGPTAHPQYWRDDAANGMVERRSAAEDPAFGGPAGPMFGGPGYRYDADGVWSGPSYSPYANMYRGPAPQ
jgi:hypothetical protein